MAKTSTTHGLTAAAARYTGRKLNSPNAVGSQSWQEQGWSFYDSVPELRFAANWIGNSMSHARLFAGRRADDETVEPAPDGHPATELVSRIAGGPGGRSQMLGDFGPHLVVAGEGWILIRPTYDENENPVGEEWRVLSVLELTHRGGQLEVQVDGDKLVVPPASPDSPLDQANLQAPVAIRVWDPHPRKHIEADSPIRASLVLLEELRLLNAAVMAIARSRLTGRGIVFVPQGTKFPTTPTQGDAEDDFLEVVMTAAETAYRDPESAAAAVPIFLEVPGEMIGKIERLTFESDFDELAVKLREETIRRFATGLDTPPEILLGMGGINHWGVWQLSQEAVRLAVEPRLATVADALTTQWLRPILQEQGLADADEWLVWYDTSRLRIRGNRSQTALELFDRGVISAEAVRRETGFEEADAPNAPTQPERQPEQEPEEPRRPQLLPVEENPGQPTSSDPSLQDGLVAAADGLVWRALERAGSKHRAHQPRPTRGHLQTIQAAAMHVEVPVEAHQIDEWRLLEGAWERACEIADRYQVDCDCLTGALDHYVRELIAAGVPHEFEQTRAALRIPCLVGEAA